MLEDKQLAIELYSGCCCVNCFASDHMHGLSYNILTIDRYYILA